MRSVSLAAIAVILLAGGVFGVQTMAAQETAAPTFSRDVAPILYAKCVSCHRPGEVAPMSLITYQGRSAVGARRSARRSPRA